MRPSDDLLERVPLLLGSDVAAWHPVTGGYTTTERWSLDFADGRRVFVKRSTADFISEQLRAEHETLLALPPGFRCEVLGFEDGDRPILALEDLRHATWPPPWGPGDVERVLETLERVARTPVPAHLPSEERYRDVFSGWQHVHRDPSGFLSLGIASREWLDASLPALLDAERALALDGDDLVHWDVRSDNLCFEDDRVVLVDWNWACRGPARTDVAFWLPSLRLEGGPLPEEVLPGAASEAAAFAGTMANGAWRAAPPTAPDVRRFQLRQLRIALPWACRELGLQPPDVRYAARDIRALDDALAGGEIDRAAWHDGVEEVLIDAYLASDDPRAQSGKGGDEVEWRWARELVLDVFPSRATFLDIGCANGYLMESLHRWGAERGIAVEPYGMDVSWRIVALARRRLPHLADRIFVGNAIDWTPPRRFDVVQAGLDEAPPPRRRELVDRILTTVVEPGGILVLRPGRAGAGDPLAALGAIGLRPDGVLEAPHPLTGELRRTAWLRAPVR